jgi:hypothetical protein
MKKVEKLNEFNEKVYSLENVMKQRKEEARG